jgi:hypothetical protein
MEKPSKGEPSPFERFHKLTKALLAVPRREIQDKLDARRDEKRNKKRKERS